MWHEKLPGTLGSAEMSHISLVLLRRTEEKVDKYQRSVQRARNQSDIPIALKA